MINIEIYYILLMISGAVFGSFFNVCIHRIPRQQSIIFSPSHCPLCNFKIPFWQNIPLLSYILLRGKCSNCHARISFRYFLVELISAFLFITIFIYSGKTINIIFFKYLILFSFGLIIFFIDWEHKIIPDSLSLTLIISGIIFSLLKGTDIYFLQSIIGAITGFLLFLGSAYLCTKSLKKDCLGGGDIKLIAALGSFLGLSGVLISIFLASIFAIFILIVSKHDLKKEFPFGPFLIFGSFVYVLSGDTLIYLYLTLWRL